MGAPATERSRHLLEPGTPMAGYRVERLHGRGRAGDVYEATQLTLGRRIALRLFQPELGRDAAFVERFRRYAAIEHPGLVAVHEIGRSEHGLFAASQLVDGASLESLLSREARPGPRELARLLRPVAAALDALHAAGLAHGDVEAASVLVDRSGRSYLGGAPAATPATADDDRAALARILDDCVPGAGPGASVTSASALVAAAERMLAARRRRRRYLAVGGGAGAVALAAAVTAVVWPSGGGSEPMAEPAPPVAAGAVALGSDLAPGPVASVDCAGEPATGASPDCTLVQQRLPGRALQLARGGVVRSWAVRGARGALELQVVRRLGGRYTLATTSQLAVLPDQDLHVFRTDLEVQPGDLVGLHLFPGSAVGTRPRAGATTLRFVSGLAGFRYRPPTSAAGAGFEVEVLLRVDVLPGGRRRLPAQLAGAAAANAEAGRELASKDVELASGTVFRTAVVRLPSGVALDLFQGTTRVARIAVPDADPRGRLFRLETLSGSALPRSERLEWAQPDGSRIRHEYAIEEAAFRLVA
jgi:hypothetical protein